MILKFLSKKLRAVLGAALIMVVSVTFTGSAMSPCIVQRAGIAKSAQVRSFCHPMKRYLALPAARTLPQQNMYTSRFQGYGCNLTRSLGGQPGYERWYSYKKQENNEKNSTGKNKWGYGTTAALLAGGLGIANASSDGIVWYDSIDNHGPHKYWNQLELIMDSYPALRLAKETIKDIGKKVKINNNLLSQDDVQGLLNATQELLRMKSESEELDGLARHYGFIKNIKNDQVALWNSEAFDLLHKLVSRGDDTTQHTITDFIRNNRSVIVDWIVGHDYISYLDKKHIDPQSPDYIVDPVKRWNKAPRVLYFIDQLYPAVDKDENGKYTNSFKELMQKYRDLKKESDKVEKGS